MVEIIQGEPLIPVFGNNFSGRSNLLKSFAERNSVDDNLNNFIYVGEQPANYISGIFPTVASEVALHMGKADPDFCSEIKNLLSYFGFEKKYKNNPFTLSGGEQTMLVVLCSLSLKPKVLSIDSAFEQLNIEWREYLIAAILKGLFPATFIYLSDNRLKEYGLENLKSISLPDDTSSHSYKFGLPLFIDDIPLTTGSKSIRLNELSFCYNKGELILKNVCLNLSPNQIYALTGKNGAGKTTMAKILTGILPCKKGALLIDGNNHNSYKFPGTIVGYSFQNPDEQIFTTKVEDEILVPVKGETLDYHKRREIFLDLFGLQNVRKCNPAELPFVMRKRVSLAATLAKDRPWYILDEPTLGQDDHFMDFLVLLLNKLTLIGKGVIIISHSEILNKKLNCKQLNLRDGNIH